jgi:hypothetical protein
VLVRVHLEPCHSWIINIDDHPLNRRHNRITGQRIFPRLKLGVADVSRDEIHIACSSLVLLKGRDLFRIRRPNQYRPVAVYPTGVVRRVAKILNAIGRQLCFLAGRHILDPQIIVLYICGTLSVRRDDIVTSAAATAKAPTAGCVRDAKFFQSGIGPTRAVNRIYQHVLAARRCQHAVPKSAVSQKGRTHAAAVDQRSRVVAEHFFCPGIIFGSKNTRLLSKNGGGRNK